MRNDKTLWWKTIACAVAIGSTILTSPANAGATPQGSAAASTAQAVSLPKTVLVDSNTIWAFKNDGSSLGNGWQTSPPRYWSWGMAPFGFNTHGVVTSVGAGTSAPAYFRTSFTAPYGTFYKRAQLNLTVDDGAMVWLNGALVAKRNISTKSGGASALRSVPAVKTARVSLPGNLIREGENELAVAVVQYGKDSSRDVFFNLSLSAAVARATAPKAVTGLEVASASPSGVTLRWLRSVNAAQYYVYRNGERQMVYVPGTSYTDEWVSPGERYRYTVRPVSRDGLVGGVSRTVSVRITS